MGENTTIAWTDFTYNPWIGLSGSDRGRVQRLLCETLGAPPPPGRVWFLVPDAAQVDQNRPRSAHLEHTG
jgi:hypothetical protein